jgi:PBSX family phage terminase large subunit
MTIVYHDYRAAGAASDLLLSEAGEVLIEGPAGTGKTRAVLEKINDVAESVDNVRILIARATRAAMTESVLVTLESKVLWQGHPAISGDASRGNRHSYRYPNGSEVIVGGLDNPDRIMSTEYDLVAVFEATETSEEAWEKLLTRLRNNVLPYQQAIADCNPSAPGHWLNQRAARGAMVRLRSRHEDNPTLTETYLARLRALTGHRRARLYEGRWVAGEGTVYPEFDEKRHVLTPFEVPGDWPVYVGIDPGYDHPCAILWMAVAPNGCYYIIDELYRGGLSVQQHADAIRSRNVGRTVHRYYGDPQHAFSRTAQSPITIAQQFKGGGISLSPWPRSINVEAMVNAVRQRLAGDRLKVFVTCVNTIREFQSWSYKRTGGGELPSGDDQFEDRDNHAMDVVKGLVAVNLESAGTQISVIV